MRNIITIRRLEKVRSKLEKAMKELIEIKEDAEIEKDYGMIGTVNGYIQDLQMLLSYDSGDAGIDCLIKILIKDAVNKKEKG